MHFGNVNAKVKIWDTAGQEKFHTITKGFYKQSQGVLLLFDVTDAKSFENIEKWMNNIFTHADQNVFKFLLGNKVDLVAERAVTKEHAMEKAKKYNMEYWETSAKTGEGINECVEKLVKTIINAKLEKEKGLSLEDSNKPKKADGKGCC
jgi:small GTP-binding protein